MQSNYSNRSTGETYAGTIFLPFGTEAPSDMTLSQTSSGSPSPRRAPIGSGGDGWAEKPDTGGTSLRKSDADSPIGDAWVLLLFATLFAAWRMICKKRRVAVIVPFLLGCCSIEAGITTLAVSPSAVIEGEDVTVTPTIASVPDGKVSVCWGVYYDADCEEEVAGTKFHEAPSSGANAVWFRSPVTAGTYYIKTSLHTGKVCDGVLDSYVVRPLHVYPADADIVLTREAQGNGTRVDINDGDNMQAYGAMRFSKAVLNDEERSAYERYNYFISFPFDVQVADIYGIGTVGTHWRICYYDGKGRAEEGFFAERTDNWVMIDNTDSVLHAGQGYLLQLNSIQMDEDNEDVWANNADIATLFFPALSKISAITTANETIPALGEAYHCTIDLSATLGSEGDRRIKDSYWRCLGVPSFAAPSAVTGITYLYEWDPADNSLAVVSSTGYAFAPTHAYLVQSDEAIVWSNAVKPVNAMVARTRTEETFHELRMEIHRGGQSLDQTFIRLTDDEEVSAAFDFGKDLIKELNTGRTNLYTMVDYERLAANCLPVSDQNTVVPLGAQIAEDGEYLFSLPDGTDGLGVWLIDNETDIYTNLNTFDYNVALVPGTYDKRFELLLSPNNNLPMDFRQTAWQNTPSAARKLIINGQLYIVQNGRLFDAKGMLMR